MNIQRRFIFRGQASGVAAHFRRPADQILQVQGCSSLPVIGGISESSVSAGRLGGHLSFESVNTSARGDFTDAAAALAMTKGELAWDAAPTQTSVSARVRNFRAENRFSVAVADVGLVSHSPHGADQPSITLQGNRLEGIQVDKSHLKITLEENLFNECDTEAKLHNRFAEGLYRDHAHMFCAPAETPGAVGIRASGGITYCTIVKAMEWAGEPHPNAKIDGNVLIIPDFGRVFFGELLITGISRRLTMVRIRFGSPSGGECTLCEGETNGTFWPA